MATAQQQRDPERQRDLLARHAHRSIRAFLRNTPDDQDACIAFWRIVYQDHPNVTIAQACIAAGELTESPRRVQEILDGWRPLSLSSGPSEAGPKLPLATETTGPVSTFEVSA